MAIIGWKIFYSDGSTFSSRQGTWAEAPANNVQIIIMYQDLRDDPKSHKAIRGRDYYDFDGEKFYKSDTAADLPGIAIKRSGRQMKDTDWETFFEAAKGASWR